MASINYAFKEISCKIVYYGPGLCGKTTNLQAIHKSVPPKYRGDLVSLATEQDRTLFFDFLPLDLGEVRGFKTKFQLYTVPGQVYYNATRRLVLRGVDGIVFVADSAPDRMEENRESITNLRENLEAYGLELDDMPWVIQYNKRDLPNAVPIEEMEAILNPDRVPSFEAVAVKGIGVKETLKGIATLVLKRLREMAEAAPAGSTLERKAAASEYNLARSSKVSLAAAPGKAKTAGPRQGPSREEKSGAAVEAEAKGPAEKEAPMVPRRVERTAPNLHILQKSDLVWKGVRLGSAMVEITRRIDPEQKAPYVLSCRTSVLGLLRGAWTCLLAFGGEETKVVDYRKVPFYVLRETGAEARKRRDVVVWVKSALDKSCYVCYRGIGGTIRLMPAGHDWIG